MEISATETHWEDVDLMAMVLEGTKLCRRSWNDEKFREFQMSIIAYDKGRLVHKLVQKLAEVKPEVRRLAVDTLRIIVPQRAEMDHVMEIHGLVVNQMMKILDHIFTSFDHDSTPGVIEWLCSIIKNYPKVSNFLVKSNVEQFKKLSRKHCG